MAKRELPPPGEDPGERLPGDTLRLWALPLHPLISPVSPVILALDLLSQRAKGANMPDLLSMRTLELLSAFLVATSCASPGGGGKGEWPPPWPVGSFDLFATVSYRMDSGERIRTQRSEYRAELRIAPDQSMEFHSSSGICRPRTEAEIQVEISSGYRTFSCQEVRYSLRPIGRTLAGSASVQVSESIRRRGPCIRYEQRTGGRVCVEYSWRVIFQNTTKRTGLRVSPRY
jgi:hypothetical protein